MPRLDMSLNELLSYSPPIPEPSDFDEFWEDTLAGSRTYDLNVQAVRQETPYQTVDVFDVSFAGFAGDRVHAWFTIPRFAEGPVPAVVEFIGYNGGRGLAGDNLHWASAGYAHLYMDTRGQGSGWGEGGATPDPHGSGPSAPGFMTRGISTPATYYYRRVFIDGVRAVEAARSLPGVDATRVALHGISQGGGISLAVAGLVPDIIAVMPDVPFLCHFERGVELSDSDPFTEITRYLSVHRNTADEVFRTLSYFDAANFAKRASAPAMFSVALMDQICPPSTVYAAFNHYRGDAKEMVTYPYNNHEGGQGHQRRRQMNWLAETLKKPCPK